VAPEPRTRLDHFSHTESGIALWAAQDHVSSPTNWHPQKEGLTRLHCNIFVVLGSGAFPVMQGEYKLNAGDHPEGTIIPSQHNFILNPVFLIPWTATKAGGVYCFVPPNIVLKPCLCQALIWSETLLTRSGITIIWYVKSVMLASSLFTFLLTGYLLHCRSPNIEGVEQNNWWARFGSYQSYRSDASWANRQLRSTLSLRWTVQQNSCLTAV
jgi:hypothetical protein